MVAFATHEDLQDRWKELSDEEVSRADVLLEDASVWLREWFPDLESRIAAGSIDAAVAKMVACAMVKRAMISSGNEGITYAQRSEVYGPMSHQTGLTYKNPEGNLYITVAERDLLDGQPSGAKSMECAGW